MEALPKEIVRVLRVFEYVFSERVWAWVQEQLAHHPGLFLGGNAYHGVALNDCTEQGQVLAAKVQQFLAHRVT